LDIVGPEKEAQRRHMFWRQRLNIETIKREIVKTAYRTPAATAKRKKTIEKNFISYGRIRGL
jgi:hypothetical protein